MKVERPEEQPTQDENEKSLQTLEKAVVDTPDGEEPTELEKATLRHVEIERAHV